MKIKENVLEVLRSATFIEPSSVQLNGDLDRKLYTETNKVLESLGLKWNRKLKLHISDEDVEDKWYNLLETGEWVDVQKEYQFFPTPKEIVFRMLDMVDWDNVESVCEPSFGSGNILDELPWTKDIYGVELNTEMYNKYIDNRIKEGLPKFNLINDDFLNFNIKVDCFVANPPFTKLQSVKHFNHMVELLNPNGQLVCVVPIGDLDKNSGIKLRQEFTKFVEENCEVVELESGDFKESGTMVKCAIVKYVK